MATETYQHGMLEYIRLKALVGFMRLVISLAKPIPPPHPDEVLQIPSRDTSRTIKVHVYHPHSERPTTPAPVLINAHGSGFVLHLHGDDDPYARKVADAAGVTVLDIQYRMAPEDPYPAGPDDMEDVVKYVLSKPDVYDAARISLGGFSAGACLALVNGSTRFPQGTIQKLILFYPAADFDIDPGSRVTPQQGGSPLPSPMARLFNSAYLPVGYDRKAPDISPAFADPALFPKSILLVTCGCDNLAPEAERLVEAVGKLPGRDVVVERVDRVNHAWDKSCKEGTDLAEKRDRAYELAIKVLRS